MSTLRTGDEVKVSIYKSDGSRYRSWHATVEEASPDRIVTITPIGHLVDDTEGAWVAQSSVRAYYWTDRPYSLLEVYRPNGELGEIYVHISSPVEARGLELHITDYELDVVRQPPGLAHVVDEDEFAEAVITYSYSDAFQAFCYRAVREALALANGWEASGMPTFPEE